MRQTSTPILLGTDISVNIRSFTRTLRQVAKLREAVGAHWITALRAPTIQQLVEAGSVQLSLFDRTWPRWLIPAIPMSAWWCATIRSWRTNGRTADGPPVHSFGTLLATFGTLVKNRVIPHEGDQRAAFDLLTHPTPLHQRAFESLGSRL